MSIWCSWEHIGTDPRDNEGAKRGQVLSYASGFGNHYPDLTGEHERPAAVMVASIAPWCVPGHDEDCDRCDRSHGEGGDVGPWLRLEVAAPETLNHWQRDADGKPTVECEGATVILDRAAVEALLADLSEWLDLDHLQPEVDMPPGGPETAPSRPEGLKPAYGYLRDDERGSE